MNNPIPYGRQYIDEDDVAAVVGVLRSDLITQGPAIEQFEADIASYTGALYTVVFSSGTAALHGAYFAAGLHFKGENVAPDEVVTTPMTFAATANAALYTGALPVFIDIEPDTGNMDTREIEKAITERTKLIVPVHFAGHPVDLVRIKEVADRCGIAVVEDACHALGAEYCVSGPGQSKEWLKVGNCKHSDMTVFSFHPVKHITTGEGGAVTTNSREYYEKLHMFRTHGITRKSAMLKRTRARSPADWYYEMQHLGYNYRMTDMQAALGSSQLKKLDLFVAKRRKIAGMYAELLKDVANIGLPAERENCRSSYHLYPVKLGDSYVEKKQEIFSKAREKGIGLQVHYIPVYSHPFYQNLGFNEGLCPKAEDFYQREISIPIYPAMSYDDVHRVTDFLKGVL